MTSPTEQPSSFSDDDLQHTLTNARAQLLAARNDQGHWTGHLSSSALSTATAACALSLLATHQNTDDDRHLIANALTWLTNHQNPDGGWGDTTDSPSNISTTTLAWAAFGAEDSTNCGTKCGTGILPVNGTCGTDGGCPTLERSGRVGDGSADEPSDTTIPPTIQQAERYLTKHAGGLSPAQITGAITTAYGSDRTFATPILTMCAISGRFGTGPAAWQHVPPLPFELTLCPRTWLNHLGLRVVSYALPALIAIGLTIHHHHPTRNPITRLLRNLARRRSLSILQSIQPPGGGFLEAIPLTSFVAMSLAAMGLADHPVTQRARDFLIASVRPDGSWPIDTNLSTWLTSLSINARDITHADQPQLRNWLLDQQHNTTHPYTHAPPGGWAWTNLPGGVPDADDTAAALIALKHLHAGPSETPGDIKPITSAITWLLNLQNRDGGIPTFCRGWGKLPFDQSAPDLTAHALRAWHLWRPNLPKKLMRRIDRATSRAITYLIQQQRADGSWLPLWFGNQHAPDHQNPTYGTSRVLLAAHITPQRPNLAASWSAALQRAHDWLLAAQNPNGGWGGAPNTPSSIEETALATEALAAVPLLLRSACASSGATALEQCPPHLTRARNYLIAATNHGTSFPAAPIGLYFARLWYSEHLYPQIFTLAALERLAR